MRVLVTGGRTFLDIVWVWAGLDLLHEVLPGGITEIIEGGASGADIRARWWAEAFNDVCGQLAGHMPIKITEVKAEWEKHGRSAGYIRNAEMAKLKPDVVLACPGGNGTANMVKVAKAAGLRVVHLDKMPVVRSPGPLVVSKLGLTPAARVKV